MDQSVEQSLDATQVLPIEARGAVIERDGRLLLDQANLRLSRGIGVTVIIGPNGAGKSLLIRTLAGLVDLDEGVVTWAGSAPARDRARRIGFVLQRPVMLARSAIDNLIFALRAAGHTAVMAKEVAQERLKEQGLAHVAGTPARRLSGGEQQRLALLRALLADPEVLFLDEPTANLDPSSTLLIETQLREVAARGTRIIMVTQDLAQARRLAAEVVFVHKGKVLEQADAADFFRAPSTPQARAFISGDLIF